jgi:uncharacterized protein involved in exopolysaccharide biosynthesis
MNQRYLDTYRQHRLLFLLPLVIGVVLAAWFNLGSPDLYRSSTSLWSDTAGGSANDLSGAPPPAAQEQTMLNELLRTQYFTKAVARKSPLKAYLEQHPSEGWGPGALVSKLRGAPTIEERIGTALGIKRVTSLVLGPHVLKISYDGPTPEISYQTLRTLIAEFERQRSALRADALTSYRNSLNGARKALTDARSDISTFMREHPGASTSDPQLRALVHAEQNALERLGGTTEGLTEAANAALGSAPATLRVVDPPEVPLAAYSGHKQFLLAIFAGLFVGALISFIGIFALTKTGRTAPAYAADVEVVRRTEVAATPRDDAPAQQQGPSAVANAAARRVQPRRRRRSG